MRIDIRPLALAAGLTAIATYALCAAYIALDPVGAAAVVGVVTHLDLTPVARSITWWGFLAGTLFWGVGTALVFGFAGWLYNRLASGDRAVSMPLARFGSEQGGPGGVAPEVPTARH